MRGNPGRLVNSSQFARRTGPDFRPSRFRRDGNRLPGHAVQFPKPFAKVSIAREKENSTRA